MPPTGSFIWSSLSVCSDFMPMSTISKFEQMTKIPHKRNGRHQHLPHEPATFRRKWHVTILRHFYKFAGFYSDKRINGPWLRESHGLEPKSFLHCQLISEANDVLINWSPKGDVFSLREVTYVDVGYGCGSEQERRTDGMENLVRSKWHLR